MTGRHNKARRQALFLARRRLNAPSRLGERAALKEQQATVHVEAAVK
jgi:hypothetical protein